MQLKRRRVGHRPSPAILTQSAENPHPRSLRVSLDGFFVPRGIKAHRHPSKLNILPARRNNDHIARTVRQLSLQSGHIADDLKPLCLSATRHFFCDRLKTTQRLFRERDLGDHFARRLSIARPGHGKVEVASERTHCCQGTQEVSSNITDVQRGASETGSASSQVLSAAQSLSGDSNRLKLEVSRFLDTVRAA